MEPTVWIYFSKTGTGFELKGTDIICGFDAFINTDGTYLIEYSFADLIDEMYFHIFEFDKSQKKRRTIFEGKQRKDILLNFAKNVDICYDAKQAIHQQYMDAEELENAN